MLELMVFESYKGDESAVMRSSDKVRGIVRVVTGRVEVNKIKHYV